MAGTMTGVEKVAAMKTGLPLRQYRAKLAAGEKWCTGCRAFHPKAAFGKDKTRADGLDAKCKTAWHNFRLKQAAHG